MNSSINDSINNLMNDSIHYTMNDSMNDWMGDSINDLINVSMKYSMFVSMHDLINNLMNDLMNYLMSDWMDSLTNIFNFLGRSSKSFVVKHLIFLIKLSQRKKFRYSIYATLRAIESKLLFIKKHCTSPASFSCY